MAKVSIDKYVLIHPMAFESRLKSFQEAYPAFLPEPEIPYAKTGAEVTPPGWWLSSPNAYALLLNAKSAIENMAGVTFVMEDDCRFAPDSQAVLHDFLENVPEDWDMLFPGGGFAYTNLYKPRQVNPYCLKVAYTSFTHAVIYNPASKDKLLAVLDEYNWRNDYTRTYEYDQAYAHALLRGQLIGYSPLKFVCGQFGEESTLRNFPGVGAPNFCNGFEYIDLSGAVRKSD